MNRLTEVWAYTSVKLLGATLLGQVAVDAASWAADALEPRQAIARYVITVAVALARILKGGETTP